MLGLFRLVGVQVAGAVFCAAVSFGLVLVLGRALGTDDFGRYVLVLNLASLGWILIEAGWPTLLYRQGAQSGAEGQTAQGLMRRALFHVLLAAAGLATVVVVLPWADAPALAVALICMAAVAVMNLVSARLRAAGRFAREALWQSAGRVASAALIVLALVLGLTGLSWVFAAWAVGLGLVIVVWGRRWLVWPEGAGLPQVYRQVLPFMWMAGLAMWLLKGDVVLLGAWGGEMVDTEQLSWYAACTRLSEAALLLAAPLGNVLLGRFSQWAVADVTGAAGAALHWWARRLTAGMFVVGVATVGVAFAAGELLMEQLFGGAYAAAGELLPLVLLMLPFALGNVVLFALLTSLGWERRLALCMGLGGVLLAVLVPGLSSVWGAMGGAVGLAVAHAVVFAMGAWMAWAAGSAGRVG